MKVEELTHHADEERESGDNLWPEPVSRLHVFLLLQDRVVDKELVPSLLVLTVADVALDLLLKLWPCSFLQCTGHTLLNTHIVLKT